MDLNHNCLSILHKKGDDNNIYIFLHFEQFTLSSMSCLQQGVCLYICSLDSAIVSSWSAVPQGATINSYK